MSNSRSRFGEEWGMVSFIREVDDPAFEKGAEIFSVATDGSRYVAVGEGGVLITSEDGINWTGRPRNRTNEFCVIYSKEGGQFVVVGDREYIATSKNGINWVQRRFVKGSPALRGVAYGNGVYVATGDSGSVFTSPNGASWTKRETGMTERIASVAYGKGVFAGVGPKGFYFGSDKGATWKRQSGADSGMVFVTFDNNIFVAGGRDGLIYTSTNGINWTKRATGIPNLFRALTYSPSAGLFIGVGSKVHPSACMIMTSPDGINWTWRDSYVTSELMGVAAGSDKIVAGGLGGSVTVSLASTPSKGQLVMAFPRGGEKWEPKSVQKIRWGSFGAVGKVKLEYSTDNGNSWTVITPATDNTGIYNWRVPQTPSNQCLVRVSEAADGVPSDISNAAFRITGEITTEASLTVTAPNGGEQLDLGSKYDIKWTSSGVTDPVRIRYSLDGGENYGFVTRNTANTGSFTWTVPDNSSANCLIRINAINSDGVPFDLSDDTFTIGTAEGPAADITLTSPKSGEALEVGASHDIRWTSSGVGEFVRLEYSTDGGSTWKDLDTRTRNDGIWDGWVVPDSPSDNCFIRVSDSLNSSVNDTNNSAFKIIEPPSITLTAPKGGETWKVGSSQDIRWKSSGVGEFVKLEISIDGGDTWKDLDARTRNDGIWDGWVVPDTPSSNCLIRVSDSSNSTISDTNDSTFKISVRESINLTSPKGGDLWEVGSTHDITWSSTGVGEFVKLEISVDGGDTWKDLDARLRNNGIRERWVVPDTPSSDCLIRVSDASKPSVNDTSDNAFTIVKLPTITLTSPRGGENWQQGTSQAITWTSDGPVDNVMIEYSLDNGKSWDTIVALTQNDGNFLWTLPYIFSDNCLVKVSDVSFPRVSDTSGRVFSISEPPEIALSDTEVDFLYITGDKIPGERTLTISNSGGSTLNWSTEVRGSWINVAPASGSGGGSLSISVDPSGLSGGEHIGTIMISSPDAVNSPQAVEVSLTVTTVKDKDETPAQPLLRKLGKLATPKDGTQGVTGSIAVTGWALDAKGVESVKIYRQVDERLLIIGDAIFVEGARPDVEKAYPGYPNNSRAGWGYTLLTNFLPDGKLVLKAIAKAADGEEYELGTTTIYLDNKNAVKPFGAIDAPAQGGVASGTNFRCRGWVLTPPPNKMPEDGSTINVFIDGKFVGKANYNIYRKDIAEKFPKYANSQGALANFDFDTTAYKNGVHTIEWRVIDNAGNRDGIGSRYFTIRN